MDSDYKTIKEELKKELRQEMTAELRELAKEEIHNLIFKERYFEPALRTYIKSLLYDDIHYLRMLNRGMVNYGETIIEIPQTTMGYLIMNKKQNIDFNLLYTEYSKAGMMNCSLEDFISVLNFNSDAGYINWTQKARKSFTYYGIFDLYSEVLSEDITRLSKLKEERFLLYISCKFLFGSKAIAIKNLKSSFNIYKENKLKS